MVSRTPSNRNSAAGTRSAANTRDVFRVLFRHKGKMVVFFGTTMALVVVGLIFLPRSYTSDARLFVRLGKESVGLDPTAAMNQTVNLAESRESEINSEMEILRSRVLLEDVVEHLGSAYVLSPVPADESSWTAMLSAPLALARTWLHGVVTPTERAIERLQKSIAVTAPRRSSVILVNCKGRDPQHAQRILQAFLDAYMHRHVQANRTIGSHEFFVDQAELLREQLKHATEDLRDARNETALVSIEGQRQNVQSQANSIEAAIMENDRALASCEARMAALKKSLDELPAQLVAEETAGLPNAAADNMRSELYRLQILENELSSRFTSLHPQVIAIRRQVAETEKIFDQQEPRRSQSTRRLSIVHQHVQTELATASAEAASQRALASSLQRQSDAVRLKIQSLNDNEVRIAEMTRKAELLEVSYRSYVRNREQARVDQQLADGRISNINVVQPATFVAKPTSPRILLTFAMGLIVATLGSVVLAFVAEFLDRSLKTQEQIEDELGIPVLFSVPRGTRHQLLPK